MRHGNSQGQTSRSWLRWGLILGLLVGSSSFVPRAAAQDADPPAGEPKQGEEELSEAEKRKQAQEKWREEQKLREAQVKELMKKCEMSRPDQQWQVLGEIGAIAHPAAVHYLKLKLYFENPVPSMKAQVRAAAADALKGQRDPMNPGLAADAAKALRAACDDRWNRKEPEGDAVVRNAIKALGELRDPASKKWLLKKITGAEIYWAEESIRALEKLRDASVIDEIIREWLRSENEGKKTSASDQDRERRQVLGEAAGSVLASLTGQQFDKPLDWQKWWGKNKRGFEVKKVEEEGSDG